MDKQTIDKFYQIYGVTRGGDFTGVCYAISASDKGRVVDGMRHYPGVIPQRQHANSPVTMGLVTDKMIATCKPVSAEQASVLHPRIVEYLSGE